MHEFNSLDPYIENGKKGYYVKNSISCHDFKWLKGEVILIDGKEGKVTEIIKHPHSPPWKEGEEIVLMIDYTKNNTGKSIF